MLVGCGYNRFEKVDVTYPEVSSNIKIGNLKELVSLGPIWQPYVICGVVTTSDSAGNFYKQIIVQDDSGSVEIRLGTYDIYSIYNRFDSVSVRLTNLSLGTYNGILQVGYGKTGSDYVDPIVSNGLIYNAITKLKGRNEYIAREVTVDKLDKSMVGQLVIIKGRFERANINTFSGKQMLITASGRIALNTSQYATFANTLLPSNEIRIRAIVILDGTQIQLKISGLTDITKVGFSID